MAINKDRLNTNISQLEILIAFLKQAANDQISVAEIGRQINLTASEMNYELNNCFSRYFKKSNVLDKEDIASLLKMKDLPSTRLLKDVFGFKASENVVFPYIDEDSFWTVIKNNYADNYYKVLAMHNGYMVDKPMSFDKIATTLNCTRMWVCNMYNRAINNLDSRILYEIYNYDYINKKAELKQTQEFQIAKSEYETLLMYMSKIEDIKSLNEYIAKTYPEVTKLDFTKINSLFSIPVTDLDISNKLLNVLTKNNILTLADIYMTSAITFKNIPNFGKIKCEELLKVLSERNDNHPNRDTLIKNLTDLINNN